MKTVLIIVLPYLQRDYSEPSTKLRAWLALPYGALSVATYIKNVANVKFIDCNTINSYKEAVADIMHKDKPDIVGFSMTFDYAYNYINELLDIVKSISPECITVSGGAATLSAYKDMLSEQPLLDSVCFGDGEVPMMGLVQASKPIHYLRHSCSWITRDYRLQPDKSPVPDLDDTLALDYSFINPSDYSLQEEFSPHIDDIPVKKRFYMLTSRGCPFACKFCYKSRIRDKKMQYSSIDKLIEHVESLINNYGMNILTLCDDQLLFHRKRAKELFRRLIPFNLRVEIYQGTSVDFIDDEMAGLMYEAGMRRVMINLESGSQTMLDIMIEKPVHLDKAKETIKILRKHNIWASSIFVMGYPGETDDLRQETMQWIKEADPDWCVFNAAIPIRGTALYDLCIKNGYIEKDKLGKLDYGNYSINVPGYPSEYVKDQIYLMNLEANFINNRSMRLGDYRTAAIMFEQVVDGYPDHAFAHWCLSICYRGTDKGEEAITKFDQIVSENAQWLKYVKHFGIGDKNE